MADQKRWFKVWTSLLVDMDSQSNEVIGAWTRLGCRAALVGSGGVVLFDNWAHLARSLNMHPEDAQTLMPRLRNVTVEEGKNHHGEIAVTFKNWTKYQEDSTQAARQKTSRSKRRGEEKRGDETRIPPLDTSYLGSPWHSSIEDVRTWLVTHEAPHALGDEPYWRRIDDWLGSPTSGVGYLDELAKYLAWNESQPHAQRHRNLKAGFRKWLAKSEYWSQQRAQTEAHRRQARR